MPISPHSFLRMEYVTLQELMNIIQERKKAAGSQANLATELGISFQHMNDILRGRRGISDEIAARLGYRKETVYFKLEETGT